MHSHTPLQRICNVTSDAHIFKFLLAKIGLVYTQEIRYVGADGYWHSHYIKILVACVCACVMEVGCSGVGLHW